MLESLFKKVVGLLLKYIFIKKEIPPTQVFSCEYCEIIKNNFFKEHLLLIILFRNFIWWWNSLDVFGYKIDIFHIFCAIALIFFIIQVLESGVHGYFVLVFIPKFLASITFARFTMSQSETASRIIATSPCNLLQKMWTWVFWILCFAITFL